MEKISCPSHLQQVAGMTLAVSLTTAGVAGATPKSEPPSGKGRPAAGPCLSNAHPPARPHARAPAPLPHEEAAALRAQGIEAVTEGRVHEALRLWLAAWKKQPGDGNLACDIGRAALMTGDDVSGAQWLAGCVNLLPDVATPDAMLSRRTEVVDLAIARARVVTLQIETEPDAALSVDGVEIDQNQPPSGAVFVKPGEHRVEARKGARRAMAVVHGKAGETHRVELPLPQDEPPPTLSRRAEAPPQAGPIALPIKIEAPARPPRMEFVWWPIAAGAAVSSIALTTGIVLRMEADRADAGVEELEKAIRDEAAGASCGKNLWWHEMCSEKRALSGRSAMHSTTSTALFIVGGVAAAGALSFATFEVGRVRVAPTLAGVTGSYQW